MSDRHWPTAASWIAGGGTGEPRLGILGAPVGLGSVTPGRCDLAPAAIRRALSRFSTLDLSSGGDLRDVGVVDCGDVDVAGATPAESAAPIGKAVQAALARTEAIVILGGNNSVTRPGCAAMGAPLSRCALLTLDAHFDLRDLDAGPGNGNPVRGLLADGLPGAHIVQIGIQSFANSFAYANVAKEAGIQVVGMDEVRAVGISELVSNALAKLSRLADRIYVDLDIDVLDRSFAPAAPGSRPGGMHPHEIFEAARRCGAHPKVAAMDIVEIDPERDVADATVLAAAGSLLSFAAGFRSRIAA